ncbi:hypothetical protein [Rhodococcus sp. X156]|uniref:hypothetical protein n=1 Tax=Rhodococcus sp. X156 TaxID=2499145 RepID=UPI000FDA1779|nr:hypothetical protein [Rhodococcus sp. X156]
MTSGEGSDGPNLVHPTGERRAPEGSPARPAPHFRDPARAAQQQQADRDRATEREAEQERATLDSRARRTLIHAVTAPVTLLLVFLVGMTFAVNRSRIGAAVSGGALLPTPDGSTTLLRSYLDEWHPVAGGTSSPAAALTGLFGLLGVPFGGAALAMAVVLLAAIPLAGLSAYCATRSSGLSPATRAVLAGMWALLPVGTAAIADGQLDTVFTFVLLPVVLAGVVSVLRGAPAALDRQGRPTARSSWLATTAGTALGLAVLASASPVMYVLVLVVVLVGFVVLRTVPGTALRRAFSLFFVILLPVGLLLPWPGVLLNHPAVLLQGVGSTPGLADFSPTQLVTLGPGITSVAGALVLLVAVLMIIVAPTWRMVAGLAVAGLGVAAALVIAAQRYARLPDAAAVAGNAGPAVVLTALGLFLVVMAGLQAQQERLEPAARTSPMLGVLGLAVVALLGVGVVLGGSQGDVRARQAPQLPPAIAADLTAQRALVLVTADGDQPARLSSPALPQLGDNDLVPTPDAAARVVGWSAAITGGGENSVAAAVAEAAASGVGAVVLPAGSRLGSGAPARLLSEAGTTSDGRSVFRVRLPAYGARVLEPALATAARTGGQPPGVQGSTDVAARGTTEVPAAPPELGVNVSAGPQGRLLVLAANTEPGWDVRINGTLVAVAPAYGHLVGVALPDTASEITVQRSDTLRSVLLLVQAGVLLFTLLLAIPPRRRAVPVSPAGDPTGPRPRPRRPGRWSLRRGRGR